MKKKFSVMIMLTALLTMLCTITVFAEDDYTYVEGTSNMANAPEVSIDTMYATSLGEGDSRYFKFTTPAKKGYFYLYGKNVSVAVGDYMNGCAVFEVENAINEVKTRFSLSYTEENTSNFALEPLTTYYINLSTWEKKSGNVKFKISYKKDEVEDTKERATEIAFNKEIAGSLDGSEDIDYYKIKTGSGKRYILFTKNINVNLGDYMNPYTHFVILNQIDEIIFDSYLCANRSEEKEIELLPNTTYYIKVYCSERYTGNYLFKCTSKDETTSTVATTKTTSSRYMKNGKLKPSVAKKTGATIKNVKCLSRKKVKIIMKKVKGVYGYQIQYATNLSYRGKISVTSKKVTTILKNVKSWKKYYVRARIYTKKNGKTYYGKWSQSWYFLHY